MVVKFTKSRKLPRHRLMFYCFRHYDENAWVKKVTLAGGTVYCSFASPNLSLWALLKAQGASGKARKLPSGDSDSALDRSKYYVIFETNEGDTPRIVLSAFSSSWASPLRGSIPVAWAVDPLLCRNRDTQRQFHRWRRWSRLRASR